MAQMKRVSFGRATVTFRATTPAASETIWEAVVPSDRKYCLLCPINDLCRDMLAEEGLADLIPPIASAYSFHPSVHSRVSAALCIRIQQLIKGRYQSSTQKPTLLPYVQ